MLVGLLVGPVSAARCYAGERGSVGDLLNAKASS
jgi:hypothetical protein